MAREPKKESTSHRTTRVEGDVREVIASYVLLQLKTALPGFTSITRVIVSRDLRQAKVLFTAMDSAGQSSADLNKKTLELLQENAPGIQDEVNRRLRMKFCPRLTFFHDGGFDDAIRIEGILNEISKKKNQSRGNDE